jgi:hypothetical protein
MNQREAQQLEKRIQREAPQYKTSLEYVTLVGGGNWGVNVVEKGTGHSIGIMESEEEWENVKQVLPPPNP